MKKEGREGGKKRGERGRKEGSEEEEIIYTIY